MEKVCYLKLMLLIRMDPNGAVILEELFRKRIFDCL
jgi:hypothetical protein